MSTNPALHNSARSWSGPVLWRFLECHAHVQSGRGLPQSKTLSRVIEVFSESHN